ncbi:MAG: MarR family winged helix-turn-helix transcriptional regulator [Chthoniobacterales bacterium]
MLTMPALDPELIGQLIHQTARVWRLQLDQRLSPLGLSQAKWRTIAHLAAGHLTQCELAERLGIEEPTLARSLTSMESSGWIKRRGAAHDRRCKTVHLQPKSSSLLHRIEETARNLRHELVETIAPQDLQICMQVLNEICRVALETPGHARNGANGRSAVNGNSMKKTRKATK